MKPGGIKVRRPWQEFLQAMDTLQSFQHAERNDTASVDVHGRPDATSPVYAWIPQENREEPQFDFCFSDYAKAQSNSGKQGNFRTRDCWVDQHFPLTDGFIHFIALLPATSAFG